MKILEKNFPLLFNIFLVLIASALIFRKPCTALIIAFSLFSLLCIKKLKLNKRAIIWTIIIALPFLLEVLFFYNNSSFTLGLKSAEKTISLILFPIFIIGNYKALKFTQLLYYYSRITTVIILIAFIRFLIVYPEHVTKYLNGLHLWEMGYVFSGSIGMHAPALNMHLAFVAIINFYFVFRGFRDGKGLGSCLTTLLFLTMSVFFVLLVNTRMALANMLLGFIIILFYEIITSRNAKRVLRTSAIVVVVLTITAYVFIQNNPYMKEKYSSVTFAHMDKVGKLDEVKDPQIHVFNSLVTRVSIWKSAWELSLKHLPLGVGGADGKDELNRYYKQTNQQFLAKYEFPAHNQFLDFFIKFGIPGVIACIIYIFGIGYVGIKAKSAIIVSFFLLFFTSNLTDDFLVRFDGIVFSGLWFSVFAAYRMQQKLLKV